MYRKTFSNTSHVGEFALVCIPVVCAKNFLTRVEAQTSLCVTLLSG